MAERDERIIARVRFIDDIEVCQTAKDIFRLTSDEMRREIEADEKYVPLMESIGRRGHIALLEVEIQRHVEVRTTGFWVSLRDGGEAGGAP